MKYRLATSLLVAAVLCGGVSAQTAGGERSAAARLDSYLNQQVRERLASRRRTVAELKTPEQIHERQKSLKAFFRRSLGDLPERDPVRSRVVGSKTYDGYRIDRVILESRAHHHITANLYVPSGKPPFPGVLVPCGHTPTGKAGETYQQISILLARNGIAAFCYDPIGQGERIQKLDANGKPAIVQGSTTEHTMIGVSALLVGWQAATFRVWDGLIALNYLEQHLEINPVKLGCTGNSGGGTETAYLMALDDRIAAAVPSCYITSLERLFATIGPQDAEQNITGQVAAGMEHADYVTMRAPRPTLISVGTRDFFDIQGSWDTFREAKLLYGRLGYGERVDLFESDEPHGFTSPRRVAATRWLRRWLLRIDDAITEPTIPVASDRDLQCTRTGQILEESDEISAFDIAAARAEQLAPRRAQFCRDSGAREFRARVRDLLGIASLRPEPRPVRVLEDRPAPGYRVRRLEIETEPGIILSATDLVPDWPDSTALPLLMLGADGGSMKQDGPAEDAVRRGRRVVIASLRGMGDPPSGQGLDRSGSPLGSNVNAAFLSLHLARPLLGQRVFDLLCLVESLASGQSQTAPAAFEVHAAGAAGLAALHAAALDERGTIGRVVLEDTLCSWSHVVRSGISRDQLASAVPGVLAHYDLPDLAARLEPRPLTVRRARDALGRLVTQAELESAYSRCRQVYGSTGELVLDARP